ncbi:MAG: sodium:alanine symporter family protein [Gammaproteobacteria bacterium]|nr:sodium:alanine symporter family protein [Gammaproteobacteria bacterium]
MDALSGFLSTLDGILGSSPWFPFVLLGVGLLFTVYLGLPQVRFFRHAWRVLLGRETRSDAPGDTSHLQALSTALSGTVGTGNIGGVALALHLGGPAALFWMWMTAFLGMATKFVEVTISHKYRITDDKGQIAGGPMYYMERGLGARLSARWKWAAKGMAVLFAVATVFSTLGSGNMPQSNNMASGLETSFGIPPWVSGGALAILLGLVIIGGIRRIATVATAIVPTMGVIYALGATAVIVTNADAIIPSFAAVFSNAFSGSAAAGGFLGASFAYAFTKGVNRGLFSNEAGQGSAPIAHASAKTDEPVSEGMVSLLEPFLDTLVICTLTGLVILASGVWQEKFDTEFASFDTQFVAGAWSDQDAEHVDALYRHLGGGEGSAVTPASGSFAVVDGRLAEAGVVTVLHNRSVAEDVRFHQDGVPYTGEIRLVDGELATDVAVQGRSLLHSVPLTAEAFKRSFIGDYGQYAVTVGLMLFAFSTAIAWSYYGDRSMTYLFGTASVLPYRVFYVLAFFLATIMDTSLVWLISAVTLVLMALPNLVGIVLFAPEIRREVAAYRERRGL